MASPRFGWLASVLGAVLCVVSCGRSPIAPVELDDGAVTTDQASDQGPQPDSRPQPDVGLPDLGPGSDGPPCLGTCTDMCKLVVGCNLYKKGPGNCLKECPVSWSGPMKACLAKVACSSDKSCQAAASCITDPPQIDLTIKGLAASSKSDVVTYTFKVCNQGQDPSGLFAVDLYYDRKSAPVPKKMGDQTQYLASLAGGACHAVTLKRTKTPLGSYSSWVQVDTQAKVAETKETNNVAGPVTVKVNIGPPKPDLVIKSFTAKVSGMDIVYEAQVCNVGLTAALFFRVDIYYKQMLAPSAYMMGDTSAYFLSLGAGACKTVKKTYKNAPVGLYNAWAQADTLNTVKESNEKNNVAGPKLVLVSAPQGCTSLCTFAATCGLFKITEFNLCLTWCKSMSSTQRACADAAAKALSCTQLKACNLPAKPAPIPPPWACIDICNYLINTCKLIPSNQQLTCIAGCITLPGTKRQCATDAMKKKLCAAMMVCIL
jgi:subtilase family serine protease